MLQRWAELVVRRPIPVLVAVILLSVVLGSEGRHLQLEIRERDQLPQDHPYVQLYNRINQTFGGGGVVVIGVVAREGDVFTPEILATIQRISRKVQTLPEVSRGQGVLSIASERAKSLEPADGGVDVHALMPSVPTTPEGLAALKHEVLADDLYVGTLVSADGRAAAIIADLDVDATYSPVVAKIEEIVGPERDGPATILLAGAPVVIAAFDRYTARIAFLFPIAVLLIGLVHYEAFRTVQAMILPLVTALLSVCWALGLMGLLRLPLDVWSAITPLAVLAIAAGHAVQILKRYYEELEICGDTERAVVRSLTTVGPVMITATVIASLGFASLATFGIASMRSFGLVMAFGILSSLAIEMSFIPAFRVLLPHPTDREAARERSSRWLLPVLDWLADRVVETPRRVLAVAALVAVVALVGAAELRVNSSLRGYFWPSSPVRIDDAEINDRFSGSSVFKVLVSGESEGALRKPEVLRAMDDLEAFLGRFPEVRKTISLADYVRRMHRTMYPEHGAEERIPDNERLIAQYLLLYSFSQPDETSSLTDPDYRQGQVLAFSKTDEISFIQRLVGETRAFAARRFAGLPVKVELPGGAIGAQAAMNEVIVREKIRNMIQVGGIIFVLSALVLRSVAGGLLVLTPLLVAVLVNFGVMGWLGVWLNMSTATMSAMGMSIGSDFGIYLIFRLREELRSRALPDAIRATLRTSGRAIFFVSSAVSLGYMVLMTSGFASWVDLGALTALIMTVAALAVVTVVPAFVVALRPRFLWRGLAPADGPASAGLDGPPPRHRSVA